MVKVKFRVRDKGGELANSTLEMEAPDFDWAQFKNLPNAEEFCRKAYFAQIKKIIREVSSGRKNGTCGQDLQSMESVITRSLNYTKKEILEWIEGRDWGLVDFKIPVPDALETLRKKLPELALPQPVAYAQDIKTRLAEIISSVADTPTDPVADYLFSKLTLESKQDDWLPDL